MRIAVQSTMPGVEAEVRRAGHDVDPDAPITLCDGPGRAADGVIVVLVTSHEEAEAAIVGGAIDALVWPDEARLLSRAIVRAGAALQREIETAMYRAVFRESATWLELAGEGVKLVDVSRGFERSAGIAREDAIGRTPASLFRGGSHPRAYYDALEAAVDAEGVWRGDLLARRDDGSLAVLDAQVGAVRLGRHLVGTYAIKRDATQWREAAVQRWIESRTASPWLVVDALGVVRECSSAIERILGCRREILGAPLAGFGLDLPATTQPSTTDRWIGDRAFEIDIAPVVVGEVPIAHVVFTDITRRKEEAEKLDALAQDLAAARDQAQAADRAKSAFLASMSHELRTPLNAILGYSELVAEELDGHPSQADLEKIQASGLHLLGLVDEVLDLARVESGIVEIAREPVDLEALLAGVAATVELRARRRGIQLELDCTAGEVALDSQRVRQILVNLVGNAVKYAVPGRVVLGATWSRAGLELYVEDEGPGLGPEDRERIFEPFRQLTSESDGVGLGLPVSRRLARALGGDLVVGPAGRGSRFALILPVADDARPACEPSPAKVEVYT
ncbi:MAG: PAS domain-containing sensor histidine kinase [Alphaproteobacteria bacterium]|nr:PAS domain-containing sensor histidine kinase [Alphaproteobacteria bacterium]